MFAIEDLGSPSRRASSLGPAAALPFSARRSRIAAARVTAGDRDPPASMSSLTPLSAPRSDPRCRRRQPYCPGLTATLSFRIPCAVQPTGRHVGVSRVVAPRTVEESMNSERIRNRLALAAVVLLVAACSSTGTPAPASPGGSPAAGGGGAGSAAGAYIPIVSKGFQHQFWQAVKKGAESKAGELGVTVNFEGPENESQVDKQLEMLQAELDKNPKAICFAALDSKAAAPLLDQFKAKSIPVIAFDSGVDSDIPVTTVATDNSKAAGEAADRLGEAIGGKGKVGLIVHDQTSRTGIDRRDGFVNEMKAKYPDIEHIGPQ